MEIPVINRISDFEAGIPSLQNPTFLSQIFSLSGAEKIHQAYSFWKWGALILAIVASFTTIINRIKILIIRFQSHAPSLIRSREDLDCLSDTDSSCSSDISLSEDEREEEEEEEEVPSSSRSWRFINDDHDFSDRGPGNFYIDDRLQNGDFKLVRRRNSSIGDFFSLSDFTNGKNIVKLWDNLGLGLGINLNNSDDSREVVSFHDLTNCHFAAVSESPSVLVAADTNLSGRSSVSLWDSRIGFRMPEVFSELKPMLGKIVGVSSGGGGGVRRVYVRDDDTGELTVSDMRKANSPLVNVTESDAETWWDADGVIADDKCE